MSSGERSRLSYYKNELKVNLLWVAAFNKTYLRPVFKMIIRTFIPPIKCLQRAMKSPEVQEENEEEAEEKK